jgi:TDG/mug DNA glycosylase family protein
MVTCFPPLVSAGAKVLILGSFPGSMSLQRQEYYAHPRNAFWYIIRVLLGLEDGLPYEERGKALTARGIALWDVLATCRREGSLDSSIEDKSIRVNDFEQFFRRYPEIRHVFFNGAKAEQEYRKRVLRSLRTNDMQYHRLPSTSPAMAMLSRDAKLACWTESIGKLL